MPTERRSRTARSYCWSTLIEFSTPSAPGAEDCLADPAMHAVGTLGLPVECLERVKRAVTQAVTSAALPANGPYAAPFIAVRVLVSSGPGCPGEQCSGRIGGSPGPLHASETPIQPVAPPLPPGGWGFFLVKRSGARRDSPGGAQANRPTIELFLYRDGTSYAGR